MFHLATCCTTGCWRSYVSYGHMHRNMSGRRVAVSSNNPSFFATAGSMAVIDYCCIATAILQVTTTRPFQSGFKRWSDTARLLLGCGACSQSTPDPIEQQVAVCRLPSAAIYLRRLCFGLRGRGYQYGLALWQRYHPLSLLRFPQPSHPNPVRSRARMYTRLATQNTLCTRYSQLGSTPP